MLQSKGEILQVMTDWETFHAPKNLIKDEQTAHLLVDYIVKNHGGIISYTSLNAAAVALASQVLTPEPKQLTVDEQAAIFQKREFERIQRETLENSVPFQERFEAAERAKKQKEKAAGAQANAKTDIELAIDAYQCYRTNGSGIDHTMTDAMKAELRTVKVGNDSVRTLAAVRQIISDLPDHPRVGDVARAVERINARLREAAENPVQKDTWAQRPR
jgi:hypothetical protein